MVIVFAGDKRWLSVVILTGKLDATLDDNLKLMDGIHVDIKVMRFSDRIHIIKWVDRHWWLFPHFRQLGVVFIVEGPHGQ